MVTATRSVLTGIETEALGANPADMDKAYRFRYRVVDLADLITSHNDALQPNPEYPQELQPRLRDRAASRVQVETMAKNLNPRALLHDSGFIDTGPMIVGSDMVVESGNGRVMALRKAYEDFPDRYQLYRDILVRNAERYGVDPNAVRRLERPVLVRERLTAVDRVAFAAEANVGAVMGMSPYERALQDAGRLSDHVVATLEVGEEQSIDQALRARANDHIVKHFVGAIPPAERATISEAKGGINQQGLERLKLAIFAKTYTGTAGQRLVRIFGENVDPVIKSMENAMFQSLPDMAKAESLIGAGHRDKALSIGEDLAEVMDTYASLKQSNITVKDYLAQSAMFEERLTLFQKNLLEHLDDIARKPKTVREFIRTTAESIIASPVPGQKSMMGLEPPTKEEIVNAVIKEQRTNAGLPPLSLATAAAKSKGLAQPDTGRDEGAAGVGEGLGRGIPPPEQVAERRPEPVMAPRTSVQTGLAGLGKEAAQVRMLEEWGTAPGAGGKKETLVDVEAVKAAEKAKPLSGQIAMQQPASKEPWQMTRAEWDALPTAYRGIRPNSRRKGWLFVTPDKATAKSHAYGKGGMLLEGKVVRPDRLIADPEVEGFEARKLSGRESFSLGSARITSNNFVTERHEDIVSRVLSEGKPVPPEVLRDYPGLRPALARPGPKAKAKRKPKDKRLLKSGLVEIQQARSERSQATDLARLHSTVVPVTSPRTTTWARDQGTMDVKGIDTPSGRRARLPGHRSARITPPRPRISKRAPRLKR